MTVQVPAGLRDQPGWDPTWAPWLDRLPRLVGDVLDDWGLTPEGEPAHGRCALVLPVRTADGAPAALKLGWPHEEARWEHLALQHWHGHGAVRLLRADPARWALLLERARPVDLTTVDDVTACQVVGGLYRRLHRPPPPQLPRLSHLARGWADRLQGLPNDAPLPRRLVEQAASLARDLADGPGVDTHLVHTDLHYENVLAAGREPWLAIDPKPCAGDPAFEPAPMLWNRWPEVVADGRPRTALHRRLWALVDAGGLDEDRARAWVVVREMTNALWCIEAATRARRPLTTADRALLTRTVTLAKGVQD
ncbi:aminoglycoside phosphotransferase family protein [Cellulomonas bogoriensis]|uniref:Aminoglycoside resistance protein n=1 Tax=Cellulomonas bogoriensis 69B4 = DSM 16987 TaxID=1386082 RepID=A0A0A0C0W0_9CELL|nr:aminoglycoside phosphotransferase family protein [Cellulomonas bogoriensis]KGM13602.1 aminoglycoside resistance protein [Cellulomonas bogoriensis 69B4 = DSM 16987]